MVLVSHPMPQGGLSPGQLEGMNHRHSQPDANSGQTMHCSGRLRASASRLHMLNGPEYSAGCTNKHKNFHKNLCINLCFGFMSEPNEVDKSTTISNNNHAEKWLSFKSLMWVLLAFPPQFVAGHGLLCTLTVNISEHKSF